MAVRNFWLEANIDGRKTNLRGGPPSKDGGFELWIFQRENDGGTHRAALRVYGIAREDGTIVLTAEANGHLIFNRETSR